MADDKNYYEKHHKADMDEVLDKSESWQAIAKQFNKYDEKAENGRIVDDIVFSGKMLQGGSFNGENLENADFSGSNMQESSFKNANLRISPALIWMELFLSELS